MQGYLVEMFGISLVATIGIELAVAWIMGLRSLKEMCLVFLVNLLTNPVAVWLNWLGNHFYFQIPIELVVILVEAKVYQRFSKIEGWKILHPILYAVILNICSWITGVVWSVARS